MNPTTSEPAGPLIEVRGARASSVIVQQVPADATAAFMDWQRGITAAAAEFPGYQATEIYPPLGQQKEWVVILHFDDAKSLQAWLDSPRRGEWVAKLPCEIRDFRLRLLPAGFGAWFAGLDQNGLPLPHWKMALTVLFGLYPIAMTLTLLVWPHTERFGLAIAMLISNTLSVSILEWLGMPMVNRVLGPWLRASGKQGRVTSIVGSLLILAALGLMAFLFHLVKS